jgi:flagellar hook assembly protein FlgD
VFIATPDEDYRVSGWTVNGAAVSDYTGTAYSLTSVSAATAVAVSFVENTISVASPSRVIPQPNSSKETVVVAPVNQLSAEFTAGPNPVGKSSGAVKFFRQGSRIVSAPLLVIYDASGNVVKKVGIADKAAACGNDRRAVGSWNLKDAKGRPVPEGTYLVKGVVKTANGKREKVSVVVGVW